MYFMDSIVDDQQIEEEHFSGLWRSGNVLIARKDAVFPDICIKTNQPTKDRYEVKLSWFSGWFYLLLLIHLFLFLIVALIVRKSAVVQFGMSEEAQAARRRGILNGITVLMLGFACFFMAVAHPAFIFSGLILFFGGLLYSDRKRAVISAQKIDEHFIHIKGVHPDFLDRLEPLATR
jgi:hypothetical protein